MKKTGIENIGVYIPERKLSNFDRKEELGIDDAFITDKIGIRSVARKEEDEEASDLCVKAFQNLLTKQSIDLSTIEVAIVVTQNPDYNIPHTAAIVHKKLNLPETTAAYDISLGCSGYVYGLATIESFMEMHGFTKGLLFTADPYSKIVDPEDKNTSLLFGDAATVTLLSDTPAYRSGKFTFGTSGENYDKLICANRLHMNGRSIFNFVAKFIPQDIKSLLEKNQMEISDVDLFAFHQGSKYLADTLVRRMRLEGDKVPFDAGSYGNTVSSSIPIILEKYLWGQEGQKTYNKVVISGFGVGLSWASTVLFKV